MLNYSFRSCKNQQPSNNSELLEDKPDMSCLRPCSAWVLVLVLACLLSLSCSKRVVVLPMPFTSHTKYHTNVARELVKLGHQVWLTMPDYLAEKGVLDTSHITVLHHASDYNVEEAFMHAVRDTYFKGQRADFSTFISVLKEHCRTMLTNDTLFHQIKEIDPDLIVIDQQPSLKTLAVLAYRLGVPFAFVGSVYEPIAQRIPIAPAVHNFPLFSHTDHMSFPQKLMNFIVYLSSLIADVLVEEKAVALYAPEMPYLPLDRLYARAEVWLVEMDHILDYPKPTLPNVKLIGGTATGPAKPLPPHFASFMDGATEGVVIVSFGSYVLGLPTEISDKLFEVFESLPMKVVFRSNLTSPDSSKIMTSEWLPQNDLLGHPNTKVFVSHCGKNGQYEALYHAVPVVATPLFADQRYNAERARVKGFGATVDLNTVTVQALRAKILTVSTNESYKERIQRASEIFRIEYGVPMEQAAFWLDHVMKYGGEYMRYAGQEVPFYKFIGVDLYMVFIFFLGAIAFMVWRMFRFIVGLYKRFFLCLFEIVKSKKD